MQTSVVQGKEAYPDLGFLNTFHELASQGLDLNEMCGKSNCNIFRGDLWPSQGLGRPKRSSKPTPQKTARVRVSSDFPNCKHGLFIAGLLHKQRAVPSPLRVRASPLRVPAPRARMAGVGETPTFGSDGGGGGSRAFYMCPRWLQCGDDGEVYGPSCGDCMCFQSVWVGVSHFDVN